MNELRCELRHDDGKVEKLSQRIAPGQEWREVFDSMIEVYCRTNTVELHPISINCALTGLIDSEYCSESASMVEVD